MDFGRRAWYASLRAGIRQPPGLLLDEATQVDSVLGFLRTAPAKGFLSIRHDGQANAYLLVSNSRGGSGDQRDVRAMLGQVIQRTRDAGRLQALVGSADIDMDNILGDILSPPDPDAVLRKLVSAGALISKAATAGKYTVASEIPLRTPTECLAVLLDKLDSALVAANGDQRVVMSNIIRRGELNRLCCKMDSDTIKTYLEDAEGMLATVRHRQLQRTASNLLGDLRSHGPEGPPLTRLLDNVYGRVWETYLNAALVENIPPKVLEASRAMREGMAGLLRQVPDDMKPQVESQFVTSMREKLPRPWLAHDQRLLFLVSRDSPTLEEVAHFFSIPSTTGYEVAGDYFTGLTLLEALRDKTPDHFPWRQAASSRYLSEIVPLKGRLKFETLSTPSKPGSGLTLAHQPIASDGSASWRAALTKVWDLDKGGEDHSPSANMLAIKHGLPYGTGISGNLHFFAHFFRELKVSTDLDVSHAILGLLICMVYEGGHPWNEGLQAVNHLEDTLAIGLLPETTDSAQFVADYRRFISVFDGTETGEYLARAVEHANRMTILYRREHSARHAWP
ncbi:hypothetical protein B0A55_12854 [Friedmanniomyces simplex]|uniref:Uncharacterized protein n=1 Tax=Friedmanniomyces simplex TaxID=329884 RepID=A0A4U0VTF0_9PEZI|nr:hypothetical protein B0A55_12854 [Friedmanniomyces simplex]